MFFIKKYGTFQKSLRLYKQGHITPKEAPYTKKKAWLFIAIGVLLVLAVTVIFLTWDRTEEEQLSCASAWEKFYEDETNEYYFSCIKSHYIMVLDNTGRTVDIVTALNNGLATVADPDHYGIEYYTEPK